MRTQASTFGRNYLAALRRFLGAHPGPPANLPRASVRFIDGAPSPAIARAHERSVRCLAVAAATPNAGTQLRRRAEPFLLAALTARQQAVRATAGRQQRAEAARHRKAELHLGIEVERYRLLLAQAERLRDRHRRIAQRLIAAQEEERREISRELHDEVAQVLTGINVQLAILRRVSALGDIALRQRIAHTQRFVTRSVTVVHRFARALRPVLLDDLGLVSALRSFLRNLPGHGDLRISLQAGRGVEDLDTTTRTVLYRVAQEALTNVVRHASARAATIRLHRLPGGVCLEVRDNGCAFDVQRALGSRTRSHLGLVGMQERIDMVGGTLSIVSSPGHGTAIRAVVPTLPLPRKP